MLILWLLMASNFIGGSNAGYVWVWGQCHEPTTSECDSHSEADPDYMFLPLDSDFTCGHCTNSATPNIAYSGDLDDFDFTDCACTSWVVLHCDTKFYDLGITSPTEVVCERECGTDNIFLYGADGVYTIDSHVCDGAKQSYISPTNSFWVTDSGTKQSFGSENAHGVQSASWGSSYGSFTIATIKASLPKSKPGLPRFDDGVPGDSTGTDSNNGFWEPTRIAVITVLTFIVAAFAVLGCYCVSKRNKTPDQNDFYKPLMDGPAVELEQANVQPPGKEAPMV